MYPFSIGVMLDSFRTEFPKALDKAQALGAKGIQVYATRGEMSPQQMSPEKRREFLKAVKDHGLTISALCGDLGQGFVKPELNPGLIEQSKQILDLAKDLETEVVTTHIGGKLAEYADSLQAHFAIETGPEKAATLRNFLDGLHSTGVAVNLDPANFVMVTGDDPVQAVYTLKDYIVHTHAKDGRRLHYRDPEILYGMVESDMLEDSSFIELPLGEGDVDFPNYLKALHEIGFTGFLTIEREVGDDPEKDIGAAVHFLEALIR